MANRISKLNMNEGFIDNKEIIKREAMEFFSRLLQGDPNLDLVKKKINIWNKNTFGNIFENKKKILEELKDIQDKIQTDGYEVISREEESGKLVELDDIITKAEMF